MKSAPRKIDDHIITRRSLSAVTLFGFVIGGFAYFSFYQVLSGGGSYAAAQTAAYLTIILAQLANLVSLRTEESLFSRYTLNNAVLWGAIGLSLILVSFLIYLPFGTVWFKFKGLTLAQWRWPAYSVLAVLLLHEIRKRGFGWKME